MMTPIGYMQSVFKYKNGTPRQPMLCPNARGVLTIDKAVFNNPEHSLQGLEDFSHIWILFAFHKNNNLATKAKVKPPRLDGKRVGLFSTRSPHRPNPIGLTLARLDQIKGASIYVSGIDILDGTPILDIKPYIPEYDTPQVPDDLKTIQPSTQNYEYLSTNSGTVFSNHICQAEKQSNGISALLFSTPGHCFTDHEVGDPVTDSTSIIRTNVATTLLIPEEIKEENAKGGDCESEPSDQASGMSEGQYFSSDRSINSSPKIGKERVSETTKFPSMVDDMPVSKNSSIGDSTLTPEQFSPVQPFLGRRSMASLQQVSSVSFEEESQVPSHGDESVSLRKIASVPFREVLSMPLRKVHFPSSEPKVLSSWVTQLRHVVEVRFTPTSLEQMRKFSKQSVASDFRLELLDNADDVERSVVSILQEDPRSVYRKQKCGDSLYFFSVDTVHVTCWFDENTAEVVRIQPLSCAPVFKRQT